MSVNNTSPGTLFGGTWQRIQDRFLLAAGSSYPAGGMGGAASVTLSLSQIPTHDHSIPYKAVSGNKRGVPTWSDDTLWDSTGSFVTSGAGSGQPHNNMPPYLTVYVWKRIS